MRHNTNGLVFLLSIVAVFLCIISLEACFAAEFHLIITVDTEMFYGSTPFKTGILGKFDGIEEEFGVSKIMRLCDKYGVKATFFVDVYEYRMHGEEKMAKLVRKIHNHGHDVQLHTHPAGPPSTDPSKSPQIKNSTYSYGVHSSSKWGMMHYSFDEQVQILQEGIEKLEKWTGERPVAHRAGGYAANYDTLRALAIVGIPVDASMYYLHRSCSINDPLLTRNQVAQYKTDDGIVLEIPVTCFQKVKEYNFGPLQFRAGSVLTSKVDIDGWDLKKLKKSIEILHQNGVTPVTIFLHSWSFVRPNKNFTEFTPDHKDVQEFDELLSWINSHAGWKTITMKEIAAVALQNNNIFEGSDVVPLLLDSRGYVTLLIDSIRLQALIGSWKARAVVGLHLLVTTLLFVFAFRHVRKRRSRPKPEI